MKRQTAIYCILAFLVLLAGCRREESPAEGPVPEVSSVIHYVARVEGPDIRGTVPTRATLDGDGKYVFQAGDRLYLEYREDEAVKMYGTLDLPTEDVGKTMAAFEGDLNCVGGFEPGSTLMLDATLVSDSDEIHTWTDDMLTGVDYSGKWAGSFTQAVEKHSHFIGTGGYKDKRFYLSQSSSFLRFVISDIDGVSAGDNLYISLSQGDSELRSATVSATASGAASFTLAFPGGTVFENAVFSIGTIKNIPIRDITLAANRFYTIERSLTETDALTIEAVEDGTVITFSYTEGMQYSLDMGFSWRDYDGADIALDAGKTVSFRAVRSTAYNGTLFTSSESKPCYIYGNMMSLYCTDAYASYKTAVPANAFKNAFKNMEFLRNKAGKQLVLGATSLGDNCYEGMFYGCTGLTGTPVATLPATNLAKACYYQMFYGCSALTSAPSLVGVSTLAMNCCRDMFNKCSSLTAMPQMPTATLMFDSCFYQMFAECTSLTTVTSLPGTTLAKNCYYRFFWHDTGITAVPSDFLPATTMAEGCYTSMFDGCTSLTAAPALPATTLAKSCYSIMFWGCTGLTAAPDLPATSLVESCYSQMFESCSNLRSITCLATTTATNATKDWLKNARNNVDCTFTKNLAASFWTSGVSGIPSNWVTNLVTP